MNDISYSVILDIPFEKAVEVTTEVLKAEGFGILTEIDVKATLKNKLGVEFRDYVILGACNPPLAHKALLANPRVGVMLPCNVTVEAVDDGSMVNFANPEVILLTTTEMEDNPDLKIVAQEAAIRIKRAADALARANEA